MVSDAQDAVAAVPGVDPGGRRARRPPRLRPHQPRARGRGRVPGDLRARGRGLPGRAAGDLPPQGAHRGDGAGGHRPAAGRPVARRGRRPRPGSRRPAGGRARPPRRCCGGGPSSGCRRPRTHRCSCTTTATRPEPGRCGDAAAQGPVGAHLDRRQRALLPRAAADPLSRLGRRPGAASRRTPASSRSSPPRRDPRHEGRPRGRVPPAPADGRRAGTGDHRPARRDREDRRRRRLPHRPAHPRGAVGREVRGRAARTRSATRTPAGCTPSAAPSRTWPRATR